MSVRLRAWQLLVGLLYGRDAALLARQLERAAGVGPSFWTNLVSIANELLVTAPLWSGLRRSALDALVPADVAEYLRAFQAFNAARNRAILDQLDELVAALNSLDIEPMPLKGSAYLVSGLFPDLGDRYLSDIDLLVPDGAVVSTESTLSQLGYQPAYEKDFSLHHHLVPMVHPERPVAIEIHRSPAPRSVQPAVPTAELWRAAERSTTRTGRIWLASPTDTSLLSFLHSQIVDRNEWLFWMPLRLFNDVHSFQRRHGREIDWVRNLQRAERVGAARSLRRYLNVLRELTGVEACSEVRGSMADTAYFLACKSAVAWPFVAACARRAERFSRGAIEDEYGVGAGKDVGRYRLRELARMLRLRSRP